MPGPVEAGAYGREHDGQQGDGRGDRCERHQDAAVADAAQERHRDDDEGQQPDRDGDAGEDDGAAGVLHGADDGLVALGAAGPLLTPAGDDEQRVVDRDAETDQRDDELDDLADLDDLLQGADRQERREHRYRPDDHRQQGEEAAEHEREDDERPDTADHGLDQNPGALLRGRRTVRQQGGTGHAGRPSGRHARGQRPAQRRAGIRPAEARLRGGVQQPERRPAVVRHERRVSGRGEVDEA